MCIKTKQKKFIISDDSDLEMDTRLIKCFVFLKVSKNVIQELIKFCFK